VEDMAFTHNNKQKNLFLKVTVSYFLGVVIIYLIKKVIFRSPFNPEMFSMISGAYVALLGNVFKLTQKQKILNLIAAVIVGYLFIKIFI
jgi:hypothetical protein